jgi:hypothetical protein
MGISGPIDLKFPSDREIEGSTKSKRWPCGTVSPPRSRSPRRLSSPGVLDDLQRTDKDFARAARTAGPCSVAMGQFQAGAPFNQPRSFHRNNDTPPTRACSRTRISGEDRFQENYDCHRNLLSRLLECVAKSRLCAAGRADEVTADSACRIESQSNPCSRPTKFCRWPLRLLATCRRRVRPKTRPLPGPRLPVATRLAVRYLLWAAWRQIKVAAKLSRRTAALVKPFNSMLVNARH